MNQFKTVPRPLTSSHHQAGKPKSKEMTQRERQTEHPVLYQDSLTRTNYISCRVIGALCEWIDGDRQGDIRDHRHGDVWMLLTTWWKHVMPGGRKRKGKCKSNFDEKKRRTLIFVWVSPVDAFVYVFLSLCSYLAFSFALWRRLSFTVFLYSSFFTCLFISSVDFHLFFFVLFWC